MSSQAGDALIFHCGFRPVRRRALRVMPNQFQTGGPVSPQAGDALIFEPEFQPLGMGSVDGLLY